jgi:hypothetical protein
LKDTPAPVRVFFRGAARRRGQRRLSAGAGSLLIDAGMEEIFADGFDAG